MPRKPTDPNAPPKPKKPKPTKAEKKSKLEKKWSAVPAARTGVYNNRDVLATLRLAKLLPLEYAKSAADPAYFEREVWPAVDAIMGIARRGLATDEAERRRIIDEHDKERAESDGFVKQADGNADFNPNSSDQKAALLFDKLGLKPGRLTETGKRSTDLEVLVGVLKGLRVMDEHARPVLEQLFHRSRLNTILTRYLNFETRDGRVFPRIKFCGTKTERPQYVEPPIQQWPREIRSIIVAQPGHVLVAGDSSQLEARILAVLSNDDVALAAFARGEDIHLVNTRDLFGDDRVALFNEIQLEAARNFAKAFLFGITYGGAAESIKTRTYCPCPKCVAKSPPTIEVSRVELRRLADRLFARRPAIKRFRRELAEQVSRFRYIDSPFGGRRYIFAPWSDAEREVYNLPMQWGASRLTNRAMVRLHQRGAPLVFHHFDALYLEVPRGDAAHWSEELKAAMEQPVPELGGTIFPAKIAVGERWSDLK